MQREMSSIMWVQSGTFCCAELQSILMHLMANFYFFVAMSAACLHVAAYAQNSSSKEAGHSASKQASKQASMATRMMASCTDRMLAQCVAIREAILEIRNHNMLLQQPLSDENDSLPA